MINELSKDIINQIAAGEIIENPASVIKELVENSIDAGADNIEILIEDYGLKSIIVKDNGCGIGKEDLLKAPKRFTTSKIKNFTDLYKINSMGFRGEALASIFSIAKAEIISRVKNEEKGFRIKYDNLNKVEEFPSDFGTQVIVRELFYNTPVRKKYLKSKNLELRNILNVITRFLLVFNDIKFVFKHDGKTIINKPKFESKKENVYYLLGKNLINNLFELDLEDEGIKIKGFIGNPSNITYPVKKNQFIFVNNRFVKSKLINDAVYEGFGTNLMEGRNPLYLLYISINPEIVDVNIHPTKIEIKFENESDIFYLVKKAVSESLRKNLLFKELSEEEFNKIEKESSNLNYNVDYFKDVSFNKPEKQKTYEKSYFSKIKQNELNLKEEKDFFNFDEKKEDNVFHFQNEKKNENSLSEILSDYNILGQVNKTFILLETKNALILIDQHVAEEKFFFEKFKFELENKNLSKQKLLKSTILKLTNEEMQLYEEYKDLLTELGFETEEFGLNEIVVRAVPINFDNELISPDLIKDILYEVSVDRNFKLLTDENLHKLATMACKKSIKAGKTLTNSEIKIIVERLKNLKEPFNCPHGRPILMKISFNDLEKYFKRVV